MLNPDRPRLTWDGVDRLLKVKAQILREPESFDMGSWCGTACCIGGHLVRGQPVASVRVSAAALLNMPVDYLFPDDLDSTVDTGLFNPDAFIWFVRNNWGGPVSRLSRVDRALWGARYIDDFIAGHYPLEAEPEAPASVPAVAGVGVEA